MDPVFKFGVDCDKKCRKCKTVAEAMEHTIIGCAALSRQLILYGEKLAGSSIGPK